MSRRFTTIVSVHAFIFCIRSMVQFGLLISLRRLCLLFLHNYYHATRWADLLIAMRNYINAKRKDFQLLFLIRIYQHGKGAKYFYTSISDLFDSSFYADFSKIWLIKKWVVHINEWVFFIYICRQNCWLFLQWNYIVAIRFDVCSTFKRRRIFVTTFIHPGLAIFDRFTPNKSYI
jgi:hypothetical protein